MREKKILDSLKDINSKYYCGSAALLNLSSLLLAEKNNNIKLYKTTLLLADEDKDYFALSSKEKLSFIEEIKIKRITSHYIYIIKELEKIIKKNNNILFKNNYYILKDLLFYTLSSLKIKKEFKIISQAKEIVQER